MGQVLGYCGIRCDECKVFVASQNDDRRLKEQLSLMWKRDFNQEIPPEGFVCDGCLSPGNQLFGYCGDCQIRKCARERTVVNCAQCGEYPCVQLDEFLKDASEPHERLDRIRWEYVGKVGSQ